MEQKINGLQMIDLFGQYFHFNVNSHYKIYTNLGGILTILSFLLSLILFIFLTIEFISRDSPEITESKVPLTGFKKIKFDEEKIWIPWPISDYYQRDVNFSKILYPVIYYYYGERKNNEKELYYDYKILNYKKCNETNLTKSNYFFESHVDVSSLNCIDMDDVYIRGHYFYDFVYHIQFDIYICEGPMNYDPLNLKCTSLKTFREAIGEGNAWHIEIYYPLIQFQPTNYNNPIDIKYITYLYNLGIKSSRVDRLFLVENILNDDKGWIFSQKKNQSYWGIESSTADFFAFNNGTNEILGQDSLSRLYSLVIYLSSGTVIYTRKYKKIFSYLGNLLPLLSGIFLIFRYITQFFLIGIQDKVLLNSIINEQNNIKKESKIFLSKFHLSQKNVIKKDINKESLLKIKKKNDNNNNLPNIPSLEDNSFIKLSNIPLNKVQLKKTSSKNNLDLSKNLNNFCGTLTGSFDLSVFQKGGSLYKNYFSKFINSGDDSYLNYFFKEDNKNKFPTWFFIVSIFNKMFECKFFEKRFNNGFIKIWNNMNKLFDISTYINSQKKLLYLKENLNEFSYCFFRG